MNSTINQEIDQRFVKNLCEDECLHPINPFVESSAISLSMFDGNTYQIDSNTRTLGMDIIALSGVEPSWNPMHTTRSSTNDTVGTQILLQPVHEDQMPLPSFQDAHLTPAQNIYAWSRYSHSAHDGTFSNGVSGLGPTPHFFEPPDLILDSAPFYPFDPMLDTRVYSKAPGNHHNSYSTVDEVKSVSNISMLNYRDNSHSSKVFASGIVKNSGNARMQQAYNRSRHHKRLNSAFDNYSDDRRSSLDLSNMQRATLTGCLDSTQGRKRRQRRIPLDVKQVLEEYFTKKTPYPDAYERELLSKWTGESSERIKNWFSNARCRRK